MMTTLAAAIAIAGGHAAAQVVLDDDVLSKDGPTWEDSGMVNVPPDCFIAASPTHVGAVDNHALAFYQRSNGALLTGGFVELHDLYGTSSGYDPRIIWDHFESRFVVSSLSSGKLRLTYSDTAVTPIDGNWYPPFEISPIQYDNYTLCGETATLAIDRPSLGFNQDCWMLSAFTFSGNADFINNLFFLVDKEPPVGGDPDDPHNVVTIASQDFVSTRDPEGMLTLGCFSATGLPGAQGREGAHAVRHHDASDALYAVAAASEIKSHDPPTGPGIGTCETWEYLRLFAIVDPMGDEQEELFLDIPVPCYDPTTNFVPDISGRTFRATDGRIVSAEYREIGGEGILFVAHEVHGSTLVDPEGIVPQAKIQWYVIEMNDWPLSEDEPEVFASGSIDGGIIEIVVGGNIVERPVHLVYPAMTVNSFGDLGFAFGRTSVGEVLSIGATIREFPLYLEESMLAVHDSEATGPKGGVFGDYYGATCDPVDGEFWGFAGYISETEDGPGPQNHRWKTRYFKFERE
jgi:hypothetical protein